MSGHEGFWLLRSSAAVAESDVFKTSEHRNCSADGYGFFCESILIYSAPSQPLIAHWPVGVE